MQTATTLMGTLMIVLYENFKGKRKEQVNRDCKPARQATSKSSSSSIARADLMTTDCKG